MYSQQELAAAFAAWEIRLYLNTHPTDRLALAAYRQICDQCRCSDNYACLPHADSARRWEWIEGPWPWEYRQEPARGQNDPGARRAQ